MKKETCECGGEMGGLEYAPGNKYRYDGVSEKICLSCAKRKGRWCNEVLTDNMVEPPFCEGKSHPRVFDL